MTVNFKGASSELWNRRVKVIRPLVPPQILQEDFPMCARLAANVRALGNLTQ